MTDHHKYAEIGFQDHYQAHFGTTDRAFTDYQEAYEYGWDKACEGTYRGHEWTQAVERDLRSQWPQGHENLRWDVVCDAVKEGYRLGHKSMLMGFDQGARK